LADPGSDQRDLNHRWRWSIAVCILNDVKSFTAASIDKTTLYTSPLPSLNVSNLSSA